MYLHILHDKSLSLLTGKETDRHCNDHICDDDDVVLLLLEIPSRIVEISNVLMSIIALDIDSDADMRTK